MSRPLVSVIVPVRKYESLQPAMDSLMSQTCQDFEIVVRVDPGRGQAWARNRAAESARGEFLWFSDADIKWKATALQQHLDAIRHSPVPDGWKVGYAYGGYHLTRSPAKIPSSLPASPYIPPSIIGNVIVDTLCNRAWSWEVLKQTNFISTMALIPRELFLQFMFDETFRRLEDWELWVRMGKAGYAGVFCNDITFSTELRSGVTFSGEYDHTMYETALRRKHGI